MRKIFTLVVLVFLFVSCTNVKKSDVSNVWGNNNSNDSLELITPKEDFKLPKSAKAYFRDMVYIPEGSFAMEGSFELTPTDNDTNLLLQQQKVVVSVPGFYICDHEVTNAEYRKFVTWVKRKRAMKILTDSLPEKYPLKDGEIPVDVTVDFEDPEVKQVLENAAFYLPVDERFYVSKKVDTRKLSYGLELESRLMHIPVYPDTTVWLSGSNYEAHTGRLYFYHPAYDQYPVVGVSWLQAKAYCQWLTDRINEEILLDKGIVQRRSWHFSSRRFNLDSKDNFTELTLLSFNLPSESDWEYAAGYSSDEDGNIYRANRGAFPWQGESLINENGEYLANFGAIWDINKFLIKPMTESLNHDNKKDNSFSMDDRYYCTSPVKSFPANNAGLYDMAGNVGEWTISIPFGEFYFSDAFYYSAFDVLDGFQITDSIDLYSDSVSIYDVSEGDYFIFKEKSNAYYKIIRNNDSILKSMAVLHTDTWEEAFNKVLSYQNEEIRKKYIEDKELTGYLEELTTISLHNAKVINNNKPGRIVKGGSWAQGAIYLRRASRQLYKQNAGYRNVGFRVIIPAANDYLK